MRSSGAIAVALSVLALLGQALAFKANEFKTCSQSSFCQRLRNVPPEHKFVLRSDTVAADETGFVTAKIAVVGESAEGLYHDDLDFALAAYGDGVVRLKVSQPGRFEVPEVLMDDLKQVPLVSVSKTGSQQTLGFLDSKVVLTFDPIKVEVYGNKKSTSPTVVFNENGLFDFERQRKPGGASGSESWPETFGSHSDSRPNGPMGLSIDVHFPGVSHVFGIPERATAFSLKPTKELSSNSHTLHEPYRLYNLDVFEYLHDHPFGLYGSIPFITAKKSGSTSGAFWLNAAEMYVDVWKGGEGTSTQWVSESGVVDLFFFVGPEPKDVTRQYAAMTGTTQMPQLFSLGYHQCRWNYKDEEDVASVDRNFDLHGIPCDVIWLDIEHTDGKRYMTWDKAHFPTPEKMQGALEEKGRKMVTIVDPHIKKDDSYPVFKEASGKGYFVKKKDGTDFDGWCWPGSSMYLDMLDPEIRKWWATLFVPQVYKGSTESLYIWNDMNEPSVFNGPEITMHKDNLHHGGVEHREVHNIYGYLYHMATADGLVYRGQKSKAKPSDRAFVLSRAFFSGTQRVGPIWTGDNTADWDHLRVSIPMCLTLGVSGLTFSGADVGGFFGNPDTELLTRWYQLGIFYPFFRAHAHIDTKRREPWVHGEETMSRIRSAIQLRYSLMPYLYTLFHQAHKDGTPVMRPIWYEFPNQEAAYSTQDAFLFGQALLVSPVLEPGAKSVRVSLPGDDLWYDLLGEDVHDAKVSPSVDVAVTMDSIPVHLRGGTIVPRRMRPRRNTKAMTHDPYTIVVALDKVQEARGSVYVDDGSSFDYKEKRKFLRSTFVFKHYRLENDVYHNGLYFSNASTMVEKIVVRGLTKKISAIDAGRMTIKYFECTQDKSGLWTLVIKKPGLSLTENWSLKMRGH